MKNPLGIKFSFHVLPKNPVLFSSSSTIESKITSSSISIFSPSRLSSRGPESSASLLIFFAKLFDMSFLIVLTFGGEKTPSSTCLFLFLSLLSLRTLTFGLKSYCLYLRKQPKTPKNIMVMKRKMQRRAPRVKSREVLV